MAHDLGLVLRVSDEDYRRLAATGHIVDAAEKAVSFYAAQLPEPVEPPRVPGLTRIMVVYENSYFEKFRELDDPLSDHFWAAVRDYQPKSPESVFTEGKLNVPNFRASEQCTNYIWVVPSDLADEFLPVQPDERAFFMRAAVKKYAKAHCGHIRPMFSGRRVGFHLNVYMNDLERLHDLGGCLEKHLETAVMGFLSKRKAGDTLRPLGGELDRSKGEITRYTWSMPWGLSTRLPSGADEDECMVRAAIRAYLPRAEAALAKAEVA